MKTQHLHDMVVEAIVARGAVEVPSKTRKYRTFTRPAVEGFYFVGKNGALRAGKSVSNSVSLERSDFYTRLQNRYHEQFTAKPVAMIGPVQPECESHGEPESDCTCHLLPKVDMDGSRFVGLCPSCEKAATDAGYDRYARGGN